MNARNIVIAVKNRIVLLSIVMLSGSMVIAGLSCKKGDAAREKEPSSIAEKAENQGEKKETGTVTLSPEKLKSAGIETRKVNPEPLAALLSATAVIEFNGDRLSKVSPRVSGRVTRLLASQGDRVKAGQTLAYLDSVELDQAWSDYVKAKGKMDQAKKSLLREETLFEKKISPEKDVIKARQEMREAEADLNLSVERFRLLGIDVTSMEQQKNGGKDGNHPLIPLLPAVNGAVVERTATLGEIVGPDKVLFVVADLSTLWVVIDIYENNLSFVHAGTGVKVSVSALPDQIFKGRIVHVGDVVDEKTRTVKARVIVENAGGRLKPGMFATVSIDAKGISREQVIAVPEDSLLLDGTSRYVFVETGPGSFSRKDVNIGRSLGGRIEVTEGLKKGDQLVVKGAFVLKSELKKESLTGE
jgi:cobalt-zinc-cadmium efflux system membrane fusion protein